MGVSEIALLVSAAFWAFLWGPIGLVLSSPLTVCLVVLGRYIPRLEFLSVLLGDEPALDAAISFYQRLLARDQDEAEGLVIEQMKAAGVARAGLRHDAAAGAGGHQAQPRQRRHHRGGRAVRVAGDPARSSRTSARAGSARRPTAGPRASRNRRPTAAAVGRAADPDLRLPGPRRRGPRGPRDAPAGPRSGPMGPRADRPGHPDRRAARPGGRAAAGGGLHRGDPARRPGAHPIPVQAAPVPVPRAEDPRGAVGRPGHHDDGSGPRGRRGPARPRRSRRPSPTRRPRRRRRSASTRWSRPSRKPGPTWSPRAAGDPPAARQPDAGPGRQGRDSHGRDGAAANGSSGREPRAGRAADLEVAAAAADFLSWSSPAGPGRSPRSAPYTLFRTCTHSSRSSRRA